MCDYVLARASLRGHAEIEEFYHSLLGAVGESGEPAWVSLGLDILSVVDL
jgi:hypothetical protein